MIKAEELRIGNLVQLNPKRISSNDTIVEVDSVCSWGINIGEKHYGLECDYSFEFLLPIPLTEEWLTRLGFNFTPKTSDSLRNALWNKGYIQLEQTISADILFHNNHIKHVHSLQNLYFALTGEELAIK